MNEILPLISGLAVTLVLGLFVGDLVNFVEADVRKKFKGERQPPPLTPADWLFGILERLIFFGSFVMAEPVVVAAWLVFKTAAKWKTWKSADKIHAEEAETMWTKKFDVPEMTMRYKAFLVGTAANIVAALAGVAVVHIVKSAA